MDAHAHSVFHPGADLDFVRNVHDTPFSSSRPSASTARSSESTSRSKTSASASHRGSHESKPRLSKDQHERLEKEFNRNHKPTTASKKQFSQQLGISLEKVNNWFQNRRAKVKHEEKKQKGSMPSWPDSLPNGVPLSESNYINDAFLQTQNSSCGPEITSFAGIHHPHHPHHQSSFSPDGSIPYTHPTTIRDCPPIQEEPTFPDDQPAVMNFLGIDNHHGRHVQLQDVNQISRQFGLSTGLPEALSATPNASSSYQGSARHSIAVPYSQNASSTNLINLPSRDAIAVPSQDGQRTPSSFIPGATASPDESLFTPGWSLSQPPHSETQFDLQQAKDMVHQLQAQTSHESPHEHHAFGYPTAQTQVANPQPIVPIQSSNNSQPLEAASGQTRLSEHAPEQHQLVDEFKTPARCDSGTSLLAENVSAVDIATARTAPPPRTSSANSLSLAQRRHKRPAIISTAASTRSFSSSHAPLSATDRGSYSIDPTDARLRRIKSSSVINSGRVSKSGQRSPLQWNLAESNAHLSRQISASSLNAALMKSEESGSSSYPPLVAPQHSAMHMHHPSSGSGSGLTQMTIPEDNSQGAESVWSRMPSTADTAHTSIYQSLPPTANTSKSYASPPHSPMDPAQLAAMHLHQTTSPHSLPPVFPGFLPHPHAPPFPAHGLISPHSTPNNPHEQPGQPNFSTEDLLMNSIPAGHPSVAQQQSGASENVQPQFASSVPAPMALLEGNPGFTMPQQPQPQQPLPQWMMAGFHPVGHQEQIQHSDMVQQHPQQPFMWASPGDQGFQHSEQVPKENLQIHQFTPQNPVEPSALPPKQKGASPRQNYSFQNFGPDFYSSPKSQSSQSKTSSPGALHLAG